MSVDYSYITLIRKNYEASDKVALLKEIIIIPKNKLHEKWMCKSLL